MKKNIKEIVKQTERNMLKSCLAASATSPTSRSLAGFPLRNKKNTERSPHSLLSRRDISQISLRISQSVYMMKMPHMVLLFINYLY